MDSHPDKSGCVDTVTVSEPHRHLTVERETVNINQVQPDLNELSAQEAESEQSSILDSDELEFRQYFFNQSSESDSESVVDSPNVCGNCMKQGEEFPRSDRYSCLYTGTAKFCLGLQLFIKEESWTAIFKILVRSLGSLRNNNNNNGFLNIYMLK